ncbi:MULTISPECIES: putative holin-like toxin [Paenibacillus]
MSTYEALTIMLQFGLVIIGLLSLTQKKR